MSSQPVAVIMPACINKNESAVSVPLPILLQHALPRHALTRFAGWLANSEQPLLAQYLIRDFIRRYQVNMDEARSSDPADYASFNTFFTRSLKPDARPLAETRWICPVDGTISQAGRLTEGRLIQAKGHDYTAAALLASADDAASYHNGSFCTLYLSPRDYHRIHMPHDGLLRAMTWVPGELYSVNPLTAEHIPGLFARNERLICQFDSNHGPFTMVLVGATIVGSIATVWHGIVAPPRHREPRHWHYNTGISLNRGDEMGRFLLGSTVILLWPDDIGFAAGWQSGRTVRLGEALSVDRGA